MRVQHIDGTLEPPVPVGALIGESEELLDEIGTTFSLPDGRWVRVLRFERDSDGSIKYGVVGELPEKRTYSAVGHEAYVSDGGEIGMGSPWYGTLMLNGSPVDVGGSVDDSTLVWSSDGRFLAATVLESGRRPRWTKVVVIDGGSREVVVASEGLEGFSKPVEFVGRGLEYLEALPDPSEVTWERKYLAF